MSYNSQSFKLSNTLIGKFFRFIKNNIILCFLPSLDIVVNQLQAEGYSEEDAKLAVRHYCLTMVCRASGIEFIPSVEAMKAQEIHMGFEKMYEQYTKKMPNMKDLSSRYSHYIYCPREYFAKLASSPSTKLIHSLYGVNLADKHGRLIKNSQEGYTLYQEPIHVKNS